MVRSRDCSHLSRSVRKRFEVLKQPVAILHTTGEFTANISKLGPLASVGNQPNRARGWWKLMYHSILLVNRDTCTGLLQWLIKPISFHTTSNPLGFGAQFDCHNFRFTNAWYLSETLAASPRPSAHWPKRGTDRRCRDSGPQKLIF